jgi:hypothetical protein
MFNLVGRNDLAVAAWCVYFERFAAVHAFLACFGWILRISLHTVFAVRALDGEHIRAL